MNRGPYTLQNSSDAFLSSLLYFLIFSSHISFVHKEASLTQSLRDCMIIIIISIIINIEFQFDSNLIIENHHNYRLLFLFISHRLSIAT